MAIKILALGDFHGKFPRKLYDYIKNNDIDIIVSTGDFCGDKELAGLIFKYYKSSEDLIDKIGKKKYRELMKKSLDSGSKILEILNSFNKPVILIRGNWDPNNFQDIGYKNIRDPDSDRILKKIKTLKNLYLIDFKRLEHSSIDFIGYPTSSYPGLVNNNEKNRLMMTYGKRGKIIYEKRIKDNKKYFSLFKKLFNESRNPVFISHNCPYDTKLDLIKKGPKKGKHYGSYLTKEIVNRLNPSLVICGHMHENPGVIHIKNSIIVNPGSAMDSRAALIDINNKKIRVRLLG